MNHNFTWYHSYLDLQAEFIKFIGFKLYFRFSSNRLMVCISGCSSVLCHSKHRSKWSSLILTYSLNSSILRSRGPYRVTMENKMSRTQPLRSLSISTNWMKHLGCFVSIFQGISYFIKTILQHKMRCDLISKHCLEILMS